MSPLNQLQLAMGLLVLALIGLITVGTIAFLSYSSEVHTTRARQPVLNPPANQTPAPLTDPVALKGQTLFQSSCSSCHSPTNEVVLGPGLQGINQRRSEEWLLKWIKNSQRVIQSGDAYAVALYSKFKPTVMPNFNYSDEEIKAILAYLK
jgi:mono/diheme cytochrome c family protein